MKKLFLFFILLFSFSMINAKELEPKKYSHIVSLTLAGDEMILALVPENRIAGLSGKISEDKEVSHIVTRAKKFPKVEGNIEMILSLEPDLIIAADWMKKENLSQLKDAGFNVYIYKTPKTFKEQKKLVKELANLVKESQNGEKIVKDMDKRLEIVQKKIVKSYKGQKPKILMYTSFYTTSGKNTTFNDMVRLINGVNMAAEVGIDGSKDISKEKVIELDPDIIIVPIWRKYDDIKKFSKFLFEDPSFQNLKAIKNKKVYFMQYIDITPTSQSMIDAIEELAKVVYQLRE